MASAACVEGDVIIEVANVTLSFGGVTSLSDVTLNQRRGEILSVIGPNGAGKTSLFNCITGVYKPQQGWIAFHGAGGHHTMVVGRKPHQVNQAGIARTFQASRLFNALTTFENVKVGVESRQHTGPIGAMLRLPRARREEHESDQAVLELLDFVGLRQRANDLASSLPYGDRRRLEIARALGTRPQLLLLDEPAAGTNPSEKLALVQVIRRVNTDLGVSVLLIEHDMGLVMSIAERIIVLNFGKIIAAGSPAQVQRDPTVVEAYLGTSRRSKVGKALGDGAPKTVAPSCRPSNKRFEVPLLELSDVDVRYGAIPALRSVDLHVEQGEIVALLGANGAGKTTTLRTISGLVHPYRGVIRFAGQAISLLPPHEVVGLGIGHVPEGRRIFPRLTVMENLEMGAYLRRGKLTDDLARVFALFPILEKRVRQDGGTLSGGEQQMLAIGRALMSRPRLLLLDEPSMGLAPLIVEAIFDIIEQIRSSGATILLVEQNAAQALELADRGYVLENGSIVMTDQASILLDDDRVRRAYLGEGAA